MRRLSLLFLLAIAITMLSLTFAPAAPPNADGPVNGLRDGTPNVHALVGARVVTEPGKAIDNATIVVRDGVIVAVGKNVKVPADARVWTVTGMTIYPGLIDPYSEMDASLPPGTDTGSPYWNENITPELQVHRVYQPDGGVNGKLRSQGVVARLVAPRNGIIRGTSAVVSAADTSGTSASHIIKPNAALHVKLLSSRAGGRSNYPNSPMGAVALARQAMHDADWYGKAQQAYRKDNTLPQPATNDALAALNEYRKDKLPVIIDSDDWRAILRADRFADEFKLNAIVRDEGDAYRRADAIAATRRPLIVQLDFPKAPNVATPETAANVELQDLMHWDFAPENPARLVKAGATIALTSHGLSDAGQFLSAVRTAVERGLPADAALAAVTVNPAELLGVSDELGTIAPGKAASFVVTDGELFEKNTRVMETWIDGRRYEITKQPLLDPRGTWRVTMQRSAGDPAQFTIRLTGKPTRIAGEVVAEKKDAVAKESDSPKPDASPITASNGEKPDEAKDEKPADKPDDKPKEESPKKPAPAKLHHVNLDGVQLAFVLDGKSVDSAGAVQISATINPAKHTWLGAVAWPDGRRGWCTAKRIEPFDEKKDDAKSDDKNDSGDEGKGETDKNDGKEENGDGDDSDKKDDAPKPALFAVNYPMGAFGHDTLPEQPDVVLFRNATVWTSGPDGVLESASVLVKRGRIVAVGKDVKTPKDAVVIDATGKHLTAGLIDAHSHIASDSGINESAQAITAEVRIGDFIDGDDIDIYRQLAGGITSSHILHGSANPIGGQSQVLKFRWGALPQEMKFEEAAPTIKFALGENVKQSNWGERYTSRYPQTRMGVEQIFRDTFAAARDYKRAWDEWKKTKQGIPPRRDLELDAIVEILEGKRMIHCHSYRQDEMLALIRVCEDFDVTIGTLQHVLEGYKVADEIAKHGAMGSSFSDWWAYKFEVYDAIPYNGAIMHNAGVVVSFNSDSAELGRRMNTEAAKAVKYGGVKPSEALKFVTLNPAKQLKVDHRVGSIEKGKDADVVLWSASPLSVYARCEQTWVDGVKQFDIERDKQMRDKAREMRAALIQRILTTGTPMAAPGEGREIDKTIRFNEFCGHCAIVESK